MNLTKPQAALLAKLHKQRAMYVAEEYRPAQALVRLGLARGDESETLSITEAGDREHERRQQP